MADLMGEATFPGAGPILDCSYTLSWGIAPGVATLTVAPDALGTVAEIGDLTITDGNGTVTIPDCRVVRPSYVADGQGQRATLVLEDHRWRWAHGAISGRYNQLIERTATQPPIARAGQPAANQLLPPILPVPGEEPIQPWTQKTLRQLAELCLEAMGETNYDTSGLPDLRYPAVEWDAANPANALEQLATDFSCVVVWRPDTRAVHLCLRGEGQPLPDGPLFEDQPAIDAKAIPSGIVCYTARTRYQVRLALECVLPDFDGLLKPMNDVSYRPRIGDWSKCGPLGSFPDLPGGIPPENNPFQPGELPGGRNWFDAVAMAKANAFRLYRVRIDGPGIEPPFLIPPETGVKVAGMKGPIEQVEVKRIKQLRLLPFKNLTNKDDLGREALIPATCYGRHVPLGVGYFLSKTYTTLYASTTNATVVRVPFTIDEEHQCVVFSDCVFGMDFLYDEDGEPILNENGKPQQYFFPAPIILECAVEVQNPDTNQYVRGARFQPLVGGFESKPAVIVRDDVRYLVTTEYDQFPAEGSDPAAANPVLDTKNVVKRVIDNGSEATKRADYFIAGEAVKYQRQVAGYRSFAGIVPVFADGAIMQVSWAVGNGTIVTRASRNSEHAIHLPPYKARQERQFADLEQQRKDRMADFAANRARESVDQQRAFLNPNFIVTGG